MSKLSRRAVLSTTGRAAVATLALGGLSVAATAEPDPIFAAIEAHRAIAAEWKVAFEGPEANDNDLMREYCLRVADAAWAMIDAEPTTIVGVAAFLAYVAERTRWGEEWYDRQIRPGDLAAEYVERYPGSADYSIEFEADAIRLAARALTRLTGGQANV